MLPSASALASRREERVRKAFSVDHHRPGDARLSHSAKGIYGELGDTVRMADGQTFVVHERWMWSAHASSAVEEALVRAVVSGSYAEGSGTSRLAVAVFVDFHSKVVFFSCTLKRGGSDFLKRVLAFVDLVMHTSRDSWSWDGWRRAASLTSYHIRPEAADGVTAFVNKPEFTQVLASAPGVNSVLISMLTLRPEALWRKNDAATPDGPGKVCRDSFLAYLDLNELIRALHLGADAERGFLARVGELRDFLKHDYRRMCVNSLSLPPAQQCSAWLCIPHGLSTLTEGAFSCPCAHEHVMGPRECDEIQFLIQDLSRHLEHRRHDAMKVAAVSAAAALAATPSPSPAAAPAPADAAPPAAAAIAAATDAATDAGAATPSITRRHLGVWPGSRAAEAHSASNRATRARLGHPAASEHVCQDRLKRKCDPVRRSRPRPCRFISCPGPRSCF